MLTFAIKKKRTPSIAPKRHALTVSPMSHSLHLQQAEVRHILRGPTLHPKLKIGQPDDIYEQEADRLAEQVMQTPEPEEEELIQPKLETCAEYPIQRQAEEEEEEEEILQAKENGGQPPEITPNLESTINAIRGGSQPLPKSVRAFFEPRFGQDFSHIRIHTYSHSGEMARAINARSFTLRRNIVFGSG